ncbi:MAG: hypothetical protein V1899_07575 [Planctomycetota bacterium]
MIEINLLPEELRRAEGTPPARLLTIFMSVALVCIIGSLIGSYYFKALCKHQAITQANSDIDSLQKRKVVVDQTQTEIINLKEKVKALNNLIQSNARYGRVLHRLCNAMPNGVWLRTFAVTSDPNPSAMPTSGKRYQIALTGYTTGLTALEMDRKLTDLMNNFRREFEVPDKLPVGQPLPPDFGWCKFINAKFSLPQLIGATRVDLAAPDIDPKIKISVPKEGLDFQLTLSFELPSDL